MKVLFIQDNYYKVVKLEDGMEYSSHDCETLFRGTLSDCEAFIRLTEGGYL